MGGDRAGSPGRSGFARPCGLRQVQAHEPAHAHPLASGGAGRTRPDREERPDGVSASAPRIAALLSGPDRGLCDQDRPGLERPGERLRLRDAFRGALRLSRPIRGPDRRWSGASGIPDPGRGPSGVQRRDRRKDRGHAQVRVRGSPRGRWAILCGLLSGFSPAGLPEQRRIGARWGSGLSGAACRRRERLRVKGEGRSAGPFIGEAGASARTGVSRSVTRQIGGEADSAHG